MTVWAPVQVYGPHLVSCWPRSNWVGAGVTEACTCAYTLGIQHRLTAQRARQDADRMTQLRAADTEQSALDAELAVILAKFVDARTRKSYAQADAIKTALAARGITLQIHQHGVRWIR